jgi:phage portal protein BeeE
MPPTTANITNNVIFVRKGASFHMRNGASPVTTETSAVTAGAAASS